MNSLFLIQSTAKLTYEEKQIKTKPEHVYISFNTYVSDLIWKKYILIN
jgi:hypothetical protein